jgi:hypothetical protein
LIEGLRIALQTGRTTRDSRSLPGFRYRRRTSRWIAGLRRAKSEATAVPGQRVRTDADINVPIEALVRAMAPRLGHHANHFARL